MSGDGRLSLPGQIDGAYEDGGDYPFPILARSETLHQSLSPVAYDCVRILAIQSGSATLFSQFGKVR